MESYPLWANRTDFSLTQLIHTTYDNKQFFCCCFVLFFVDFLHVNKSSSRKQYKCVNVHRITIYCFCITHSSFIDFK